MFTLSIAQLTNLYNTTSTSYDIPVKKDDTVELPSTVAKIMCPLLAGEKTSVKTDIVRVVEPTREVKSVRVHKSFNKPTAAQMRYDAALEDMKRLGKGKLFCKTQKKVGNQVWSAYFFKVGRDQVQFISIKTSSNGTTQCLSNKIVSTSKAKEIYLDHTNKQGRVRTI